MLAFTLSAFPMVAMAQALRPGFDALEYRELIYVATPSTESTSKAANIPAPSRFRLAYSSRPVGFDNQWELWTDGGGQAVICTRGSTSKSESWLANFYAAMVPATGKVTLAENDTFAYALSTDPRAAVHVGYLLSLGFLAKDIVAKLDSCYKQGMRDYLIFGHSQGGGISYLITAYLRQMQLREGRFEGARFKTYCSAGPKPGNLYFAYNYEYMTQGGWAFNVVNAADWVPQVPFTVETTDDFNPVSPLGVLEKNIAAQKFPKKQGMRYLFNRLDKPSKKTLKAYQKYMGNMIGKKIEKIMPGFKQPAYCNSSNYVRTATQIVLYPDTAYRALFRDDSPDWMIHHSFPPYLYLLDKMIREQGLE